MRRLFVIPIFLLAAAAPASVHAGKVETSATIVSLTPSCTGISVTASGSYQVGIGRVDFRLIDLTKDPTSTLVDEKVIYYAKPHPKQVTESWASTVPLTPGTPYRVFFLVWDTGPWAQVVASDRRNFTCS